MKLLYSLSSINLQSIAVKFVCVSSVVKMLQRFQKSNLKIKSHSALLLKTGNLVRRYNEFLLIFERYNFIYS